jgi:hypothetical protein
MKITREMLIIGIIIVVVVGAFILSGGKCH